MGRRIVFLGKVGHGKTRLVNVLTNSRYDSSAAAASCTRGLQMGKIPKSDMTIIDTPGFYSSEEVTEHINAQIEAFVQPICGIYIIVRIEAPSVMAEVANRMMDFTGEEDVRVICTYLDTVDIKQGFDGDQVAAELARLLDIPTDHIAMVGKDTDVAAIENFIFYSAHRPRQVEVAEEQRSVVASLSVGSRKFNQEIEELAHILNEADQALTAVMRLSNGEVKTFARTFLSKKAQENFGEGCNDIETRAKELIPGEQNLVSSKLDQLKKKSLKAFEMKHKPTRRDDDDDCKLAPCGGRSNNRSRNSFGRSTYGRNHLHRHNKRRSVQQETNRNQNKAHATACQPPNQETKDLESALYSFFLAQFGTKNKDRGAERKEVKSHSGSSHFTMGTLDSVSLANLAPGKLSQPQNGGAHTAGLRGAHAKEAPLKCTSFEHHFRSSNVGFESQEQVPPSPDPVGRSEQTLGLWGQHQISDSFQCPDSLDTAWLTSSKSPLDRLLPKECGCHNGSDRLVSDYPPMDQEDFEMELFEDALEYL